MISVMLDLETWGTAPGCDLRSIGACVFDPTLPYSNDPPTFLNGPTRFYRAVDNPIGDMTDPDHNGYFDGVDAYRRYNLTRDPATVQWWSEQSDEAQAAFADPVDLREGLLELAQWLHSVSNRLDPYRPFDVNYVPVADIRLWSHGPAFDPPILAAAYAAVGLPVPWHYRAPRDTRTIFDLAGIEDHSAWLKQHPGPLGISHHALDDSICQARAVCGAQGIIRRWYLTSKEGFESELNNITRAIEDEGDRAYFGSTNDADLLRQIAEGMDANRFERDLGIEQ